MNQKFNELLQEFQTVFSGRSNTVDAIIPPLVYALVNALAGLLPATLAALDVAVIFMVLRLIRKQSWQYAFGGLVFSILTAGFAWYTQNAANFFLPGLISSGALLMVALLSNLTGKPLAAWSSHLTRAWPKEWYWLPKVRPAYSEVTWMWVVLIAARLLAQYALYKQSNVVLMGFANIMLGWPATIAVLVISYLYGSWRLKTLGGPSVEEFTTHQPPPWQGQNKGF